MKKPVNGDNHYESIINIAHNGYVLYQADFVRLHDMYKGKMPEDMAESLQSRRKSSIVVNKAYALIQRLKASTEQAYFTNNSFASFVPLNAYEENASEEMQKAFDHYWNKLMKSYTPLSRAFLDGYIYGTPTAKVYWSNGYPVIENINVHDLYFDPSAKEFSDCRFMINNVYMTNEDVAQYKKLGIYNKKFKVSEIMPNNKNDGTLVDNAYIAIAQDENSYGRVVLQDVYEKLGGSWYVTTTYNKKTVLRERVLLEDGLPIFAGKTVPNTLDYNSSYVGSYSDSVLAPVYDLQLELNLRVNQEIDAISETLNPSYMAERGSGINEIDMRKGPSRIVYVANLEQVQQISPPNVTALKMNEDRIRTDIEEITGVQMLGSADTSAIVNRQTADGMNILSSEKSLRTDNYVRTVNETFVEPMIAHIGKLIWKYCDLPEFFKGIDRSKDYNFSVNVAAGLGATSKQVQLNGLDQAFGKFMQLGDNQKAEQTVMDSLPLLGIKNTAEYFEPKTSRQKREEKAMQKAQSQKEQKKQQVLIERKTEAEIAKLENEAALDTVEAAKIKQELEMAKTTGESQLRVDLERIAVDNRRLDIDEQKLYLQIEDNKSNMEEADEQINS